VRHLGGRGENNTDGGRGEGGRNADVKQLEAVASQLEEVGIRLQTRSADQTTLDTNRTGGNYTAMLTRLPVIVPTRETCESFPAGTNCPNFNKGGDRLDFEVELAAAFDAFVASNDAAERADLARNMQKLMTENVYYVGTVQIPAALLVNKRIRNAHPGTPVFMYEWAEDGVMRERLWTPAELQVEEVLPGTVAEY